MSKKDQHVHSDNMQGFDPSVMDVLGDLIPVMEERYAGRLFSPEELREAALDYDPGIDQVELDRAIGDFLRYFRTSVAH